MRGPRQTARFALLFGKLEVNVEIVRLQATYTTDKSEATEIKPVGVLFKGKSILCHRQPPYKESRNKCQKIRNKMKMDVCIHMLYNETFRTMCIVSCLDAVY